MSQINREQLIELYKKAVFEENYSKGQITVDSPALVRNLQLAFDSENSGWSKIGIDNIVINKTYYSHIHFHLAIQRSDESQH